MDAFTVTSTDAPITIDVLGIKAAALAEAARWNGIRSSWDLMVGVYGLIGKINSFVSVVGGDWSVLQQRADLPGYPSAHSGSVGQEATLVELTNVMAEQAVLGDAFIRQFEKYQGAEAAGDDVWTHATAAPTRALAGPVRPH